MLHAYFEGYSLVQARLLDGDGHDEPADEHEVGRRQVVHRRRAGGHYA